MIDRSERIRGETHVCNAKAYCPICREKSLKGHTCAHHVPDEMEKLRKQENQKQWAIIVYDMECIVAESGLFEGKDVNIQSINLFFQDILKEVPSTNLT